MTSGEPDKSVSPHENVAYAVAQQRRGVQSLLVCRLPSPIRNGIPSPASIFRLPLTHSKNARGAPVFYRLLPSACSDWQGGASFPSPALPNSGIPASPSLLILSRPSRNFGLKWICWVKTRCFSCLYRAMSITSMLLTPACLVAHYPTSNREEVARLELPSPKTKITPLSLPSNPLSHLLVCMSTRNRRGDTQFHNSFLSYGRSCIKLEFVS
jgi:hypothetical protein